MCSDELNQLPLCCALLDATEEQLPRVFNSTHLDAKLSSLSTNAMLSTKVLMHTYCISKDCTGILRIHGAFLKTAFLKTAIMVHF